MVEKMLITMVSYQHLFKQKNYLLPKPIFPSLLSAALYSK